MRTMTRWIAFGLCAGWLALAPAADAAQLTWWSHWAVEDSKKAVLFEVKRRFEAKHPGNTVEITFYEKKNMWPALRAAFTAGSGFPDVFYYDQDVPEFVTAGWLADLTEKWPFIYCTESYWRTVIAGEWPNCPLWVARWRPPPYVPPQPFPVPVGAAQPELWQFTNGLTVPGIDQPVDGNRYFGDLARLRDHLV